MKLNLTSLTPWLLIALLAMLAGGSGVSISFAQDSTDNVEEQESESNDPYGLREKPDVGKNIGVRSKTGDFIPGDITFTDEENRFVEIGRYFDGKQPVMLSFNYSN